MTKLHSLISIVILTITMGCTRQEKPFYDDNAASLPSLYITLPPQQFDSILNNQEIKVPAEALLLNADNDTLYEGSLSHIKTRGNSTFEGTKKTFWHQVSEKTKVFGAGQEPLFCPSRQ